MTTWTCTRHPSDPAVDVCEHCALAYCPHCLIYARGEHKPPLCQRCVLVRTGARPGIPAAERRRFRATRAAVLDQARDRPVSLGDALRRNLAWLDDIPYDSQGR